MAAEEVADCRDAEVVEFVGGVVGLGSRTATARGPALDVLGGRHLETSAAIQIPQIHDARCHRADPGRAGSR